MTLFKRKRVANSEAGDYASAEDFRRAFSDERDALARLLFLLTGDQETTEQCLVAGLEDSVKNTDRVFKEWAGTWVKRAIIQKAIFLLKPRPPQHAMSSTLEHAAEIEVTLPSISDRDLAKRSALVLDNFERFVFVITVLEGYSEHHCALLLYASLQDVRNARIRAIEHIATAQSSPMLLPRALECSTSRDCT